jgi:hypothetical protein
MTLNTETHNLPNIQDILIEGFRSCIFSFHSFITGVANHVVHQFRFYDKRQEMVNPSIRNNFHILINMRVGHASVTYEPRPSSALALQHPSVR